jgi:hypothetical protein
MDWNLYILIQKPAYQAILFLLLTPIVIFVLQPKSADVAWTIAALAFALFLLVNAVMLWFDDSPWRYFFYSVGFAVGYIVIIGVVMPYVLKVLRLTGSQESSMAFLILMYQPVALLLVMLIKWVVTRWF